MLGREGNIGLLQVLHVKGKHPFLGGQSPEELHFVHSLLLANRESGNINTHKIKTNTNPRETSSIGLALD